MDELPDERRVAVEGVTDGAAGTRPADGGSGAPRDGDEGAPGDGDRAARADDEGTRARRDDPTTEQESEPASGVFAEFVATVPDPVLVVDGNGRIAAMNAAASGRTSASSVPSLYVGLSAVT